MSLTIQSNPAISNSDNSTSPLFRTKIEFPWIYPYVLSYLLSAISNSVISPFPAISNSSFFPYTLNQPRYFELVKIRVQEQTPKRPRRPPRKIEVRQRIETLSRYNLFATEGAEIGGQTEQASCRSTKV